MNVQGPTLDVFGKPYYGQNASDLMFLLLNICRRTLEFG